MHPDRLIAASVSIAIASSLHAQTHVFVDDDAPDGGDGLSWNSAFNDLHDAIDLAQMLGGTRGEIRIAGGVYRPDRGTGDLELAFHLSAPDRDEPWLALRGGYAGLASQGSPNTRDPDVYATILSGDLLDDDLPNGSLRTDNSNNILIIETDPLPSYGIPLSAVSLSGLQFHGASGAAITNIGVELSVVLTDCRFEDNHGDTGCAVSMQNAAASFRNCVIANNGTFMLTPSGEHGPVEFENCNVYLRNCIIDNNYAQNSSAGAIYANESHLFIEECVVSANSAWTDGGAIVVNESDLVIRQSQFLDNHCDGSGGAIYSKNSVIDTESTQFNECSAALYGGVISIDGGKMSIKTSEFKDNQCVSNNGGAIYSGYYAADDVFELSDCTFTNNQAGYDGGAVCTRVSIDINSTTFTNNTAVANGGAVCFIGAMGGCTLESNSAGLYGGGVYIGDGAAVRYCDFYNNTAMHGGGAAQLDDGGFVWQCDFVGNIATDNGGGVRGVDSVIKCYFEENNARRGGAVYATKYLTNSILIRNHAHKGGGIYNAVETSGSVLIQNTAKEGSAAYLSSGNDFVVSDSILYSDSDRDANEILVWKTNTPPLEIIRSTLVRVGDSYSPMINCSTGFVWVESSIVWDYAPTDVPTYRFDNGGSLVVVQSITQMGLGDVDMFNPGDVQYFGTNYELDPMFTDPHNGDLTLQPGSPAIDSGYQSIRHLPTRDALGNLREPLDDAGVINRGFGVTTYLDTGALEFMGTSCLPDINNDGVLTPADFASWIAAFNVSGAAADQNRDGIIDEADFTAWIINFTNGC